MTTQIFVNLPVKDLNKSIAFFKSLGYSFNPKFTNESGACMIISDTIYAMILSEAFFQTFTDKPVADATKSKEVLIALSAESKEAVTEMVNKALAAGGKRYREPQDLNFMYQDAYEDLDGHQWEIFWMDPDAVMPE